MILETIQEVLVDMRCEMSVVQRARHLQLVIFDVDGVLTDGGIYMGTGGEVLKRFSSRDGMGITLLRRAGLRTAIITGRESDIVELRAAELQVDEIWQGCQDKRVAYNKLKEKYGFSDENIGYIGDDLLDIPIMLQAGFAAAVGDAANETKQIAHMVADARGGLGAVREVAEFILKAQNKWEAVIADYYNTAGRSEAELSAQ